MEDKLMNQRIPKSICPALENYLSLVRGKLPDLMSAFYIVGSIALDGFNERFSDIDFVAVLNRRATPADIENLCHIHRAIDKNCPRWKMSGSYLQADDLGHFDDEVELHPACHDGVLRPAEHFELNSVTWWILKNHSIAVIGSKPQALSFTVDWNLLITRMRENLNTFWGSYTKRPGRIVSTLSDWGVQWTVLGVLRQFYTFRENTITTKEKAGVYALSHVPTRWHRLIREAINIREGKKPSAYRLRIARTIEVVNLTSYIIQTCNARFTQVSLS
jgi:hypothetical protein